MSAAVGVDLYASSTNETLHKPWLPVSELPTTNLQQGAIAIIILFPVLAFLVWGVRMYSRWSTKQVGIGTISPGSGRWMTCIMIASC
jgi:hypothetical protein